MVNTDNFLINLSPKKTFDAIIESPNPKKIVKQLDPIRILSILSEVGASDALELVELLSSKQVLSILDFSVWNKDSLDKKIAGDYLCLLFEANPEKAIKQIHKLDREFLGLMFKQVCSIYDLSLEEEPDEYPSLYSISPDGRFLIGFSETKENEKLSRALHEFLERMYGEDIPFALNLIEDVRFEIACVLEESAFNFRNHRIADYGILPKEEALELLASIKPNQLTVLKQNPKETIFNQESLTQSFNPHIDDTLIFIKEALKPMDQVQRNYFLDLLSHTSLNMHFLLTQDLSDLDQIKRSSKYVAFLLELGLFRICKGQKESSFESLEKYGLKQLVRLGRSMLLNLREVCFGFLKDENIFVGEKFSLVDSPLREVAKASCGSEPLYYEGLLNPQKLTTKYFTSHIELNATLMAISELKTRSMIVSPKILGFNPKNSFGLTFSHSSLIATFLLNSFLQKEDKLAKLTHDDFEQIFVSFSSFGNDHQLKNEVVQFFRDQEKVLLKKLDEQIPGHAITPEKINSFLNAVMIKLEQNYQELF